MRVGIAFVPAGPNSTRVSGIEGVSPGTLEGAFSEPQQRELLKRVAEAFRGTQDVAFVEVLPTHNLKGKGGFDELRPIAAMYGLNLLALVSYDQIQFDDRDASSLLYWTIVGAYVVPGDLHETQTLLDASVFDMATRALLFSGSGSSVVKGRSNANDVRRKLRAASVEGFEKAADDLIANLQISLGVFRENARQGTVRGLGTPSVQVHRPDVQAAASAAGALAAGDLAGVALLALAAAMALRDRPRARALRVPWWTFGFVAAALWVSFGPRAESLTESLLLTALRSCAASSGACSARRSCTAGRGSRSSISGRSRSWAPGSSSAREHGWCRRSCSPACFRARRCSCCGPTSASTRARPRSPAPCSCCAPRACSRRAPARWSAASRGSRCRASR